MSGVLFKLFDVPNTVCCAKSQLKSSLILAFYLKQIVVEDLGVGVALQGNTRKHKPKEMEN